MADRYTVDGCAILDSGFHIGDLISPQHAQSIAAAMNATPAAVPQSPSYDALVIIAQSVCGALSRAGFDDLDDPGEAIDVMRERYERRIAELQAPPAAVPDWAGHVKAAVEIINAAAARPFTVSEKAELLMLASMLAAAARKGE